MNSPGDGSGIQVTVGNDRGDEHLITQDELADILGKSGLEQVVKDLGIDTREKMSDHEAETLSRVINAVRTSEETRAKVGDAYPGSHINGFTSSLVNKMLKPRLNWRHPVSEFLYGEGTLYRKTMDVPSDLYYVDPADTGMGTEIYLPGTVPVKSEHIYVWVLDSSGSVGQDLFARLASEAVGMARQQDDAKADVLVICADTIVRGKPVLVTEENLHEIVEKKGFERHGHGGTDFVVPLRQAVKFGVEEHVRRYGEEPKWVSVIYATDLECYAPPEDSLPEKLGGLLFIGPETALSDSFAKNVENYAKVVALTHKDIIDLEALENTERMTKKRLAA